MSTYIESLILFILCLVFFPIAEVNAVHIMLVLIAIIFDCLLLSINYEKGILGIGIAALILGLWVPDFAVFLPMLAYVFMYRKQFAFPCLYCVPLLFYLYEGDVYQILGLIFVALLSMYLSFQNRNRQNYATTIKSLRDNSVEQEMILRKSNLQLLESQNDQIYIATLKERNRIAREIHDSVGHMLSRSILQVGALLSICTDEAIKPHLVTLKDTLNEAMNSIRNSVHDLHDEAVDLTEAIKNIINEFTFCPVHFECDVSKHVPKEIKYSFLAITKEALNNIMRHSNATKVSITVKEHPALFQLLIEDNGTKISSHTEDSPGIGLNNMKERINSIHGNIHITTDNGFRIFISVPK